MVLPKLKSDRLFQFSLAVSLDDMDVKWGILVFFPPLTLLL